MPALQVGNAAVEIDFDELKCSYPIKVVKKADPVTQRQLLKKSAVKRRWASVGEMEASSLQTAGIETAAESEAS